MASYTVAWGSTVWTWAPLTARMSATVAMKVGRSSLRATGWTVPARRSPARSAEGLRRHARFRQAAIAPRARGRLATARHPAPRMVRDAASRLRGLRGPWTAARRPGDAPRAVGG